jgi:hypothetical protein
MSSTKGKTRTNLANPLELGREVVRSLGHQAAQGTLKETQDSAKTFLEQLLGISLKKNADRSPAEAQAEETTQTSTNGHIEVFNFQKHHGTTPSEKPRVHAEQTPRRRAEAAIDYHRDIVKNRERASKGELKEMNRNIEQIKIELSKLVSTSQVLKLEFAEVTVEQSTTTVGQYHLNFFEWMLAVIRSAREKVEDSGAWLGAVKGKGAKRGYWGMFKKHGTMFGLSGERAVATQVG